MTAPAKHVPLAIVGMACRLPGADGIEAYRRLLRDGVDAIRELPPDRLDRELYYDPRKGERGKTYSSLGGLIDSRPLDRDVCPLTDDLLRDADPCHVLFCETAARAMRDAGYDPFAPNERISSRQRMGVYVGHSGGSPLGVELDFASAADDLVARLRTVPAFASLPQDRQNEILRRAAVALRQNRPQRRADGGPFVETNEVAALTARAFGLAGPQVAIDAACASSPTALLAAASALALGTIDSAIVGGASYAKADSLLLFSQAQSCSATMSRPFDADADGLISSEGYVALVLKTLDRAVADGDRIHAVIRGVGCSTDGRGKSLWAPRKEGQLTAIRRAYPADVPPESIQYVETHATSTQLGDATEVAALAEFFQGTLPPDRRIPIGSVKSNLGHTLETAGLAGLLKTVLAIQDGVIPPSIHVRELNRDVDWSRVPLEVVRAARPWPTPQPGRPRRAGVNSFGIGGLNVHLLVEEYLPSASPHVPPSQISADDNAIAIVGRGVVLPGAKSIAEFRELLTSGRDAKGSTPNEPRRDAKTPRTAGYVRDYRYDWRRHKIPPKQMEAANPLQFMLLDAVDQALDEAEAERRQLARNTTGVVVGSIFGGDFGRELTAGLRLPELRRAIDAACAAEGVDQRASAAIGSAYEERLLRELPAVTDETGGFTCSTLASRITKNFDLGGGAAALDAGESSGAAALELARDWLLTGRCGAVLCAAAQRSLDATMFGLLERRGFVAPGFIPGEGVAVVLLKRLGDARRDGDRIFGILPGTGAVTAARHPQATSAAAATSETPAPRDKLAVQIGYVQGVHALASVVRATIEFEREQVPTVATPVAATPKEITPTTVAAPPRLVRFGAESFDALKAALADGRSEADELWSDAGKRRFRPHETWRAVLVAKSGDELRTQLGIAAEQLRSDASLDRLERHGILVGRASSSLRVAGMFPGQGSHSPGMLRELCRQEPTAAAVVAEADALLLRHRLPTFTAFAWGDAAATAGLTDPRLPQLAVLTADLAYWSVLRSRGFRFDCVGGHSFGEFAALVAAGSWTFAEAFEAALARHAAVAAVRRNPGMLLAVAATAEEVEPLLDVARRDERLTIFLSHLNAPRQTVIAGEPNDVQTFAVRLNAAGLATQTLDVPYPYHTPLLADAVATFRKALNERTLGPPRMPLVSHVSNRYAAEPDELRDNLAMQLTQPVRYVELIRKLEHERYGLLVEIGPRPTLTGFHRRTLNGGGGRAVACDDPGRSAAEQLLFVQALWECCGGELATESAVQPTKATTTTSGSIEASGPIETFDATQRRRTRLRTSGRALPNAAAYDRPTACEPVAEWDATAARRDRNAGRARDAEPTPVADPAATVPAAAPSAPSPVRAESKAGPALEKFLVNFVVEQTGYPAEIVDLDADLEADLGIDSIKKAQLFGELREYFELPPRGDLKLSDFNTLRRVAEFLSGLNGKGDWLHDAPPEPTPPAPLPPVPVAKATPPASTPIPSGTADLERFLINFVVEQTGYPAEIVDLDADLEADLGIDSIKKAQIFGELREHATLTMEGEFKLSNFATLRDFLQLFGQASVPVNLPTSNVPSPTSPQVVPSHSTPKSPAFEPSVVAKQAAPTPLRESLHAELRRRADRLPSGDATMLSPAAVRGRFSAERLTTLQAEARTAGVALGNLLRWELDAEQGCAESNGTTTALLEEPETAVEAPASTEQTHRYLLQLIDKPRRTSLWKRPPFPGSAVIVGDNPYADALTKKLATYGVATHCLGTIADPDAAVARFEEIWRQGVVSHVFITTPRDAEAVTDYDPARHDRRHRAGVMVPFRLCQRWLMRLAEVNRVSDAHLIALTSLGGEFGLDGNVIATESGAVAGLLKAIFIEQWVQGTRGLPIKIIDSPPDADPSALADEVFEELRLPTFDVETSFVRGRRRVLRALPQPLPELGLPKNVRRGAVWVCTGGARGITAHAAMALAKRYGLRLHLLGTAPVPNIPEGWRELSETGLRALRESVMKSARAAGKSPFDAWLDTEKAMEIDRNLREFAAAGIAAKYYSLDVADRAALAAVLDEIRRTDGPIEGILHGAGVGKDARFDRKDPKKVAECYRSKMDGAARLMELTRRDPVRHFIGFGSISGRFGANGHADYSSANDMLCKQINWLRRQRPDCRCLGFHWHAWGDVGMAMKPEAKLALELVDIQFMPAVEGLAHLMRELEADSAESEVLITNDEYYRRYYGARSIGDDDPNQPRGANGSAAPRRGTFVPVRGATKTSDGARFEAPLDPQRDVFLREHRLDDRPLLPVVVGLELLVEGAEAMLGKKVTTLENVEALTGLRFHTDDLKPVRVQATPAGGERCRCLLTADVTTRDGRIVEAGRSFLVGEASTHAALPGPLASLPDLPWTTIEYGPRGAQFYGGMPLRALKQMWFSDGRSGATEAWGRMIAPAMNELAGSYRDAGGWRIPSSALDACLYTVGQAAWRQVRPGTALPKRFGRLSFGRLPDAGEACYVQVRLNRVDSTTASFEFTLYGIDGAVLIAANDYTVVWLA